MVAPVGRIERQVQNDAWELWGLFLKLILGFGVLAWPIVVIDYMAFGPKVSWWQWTLGGLAEAVWLPILVLLVVAHQKDKNSRPVRRRRY